MTQISEAQRRREGSLGFLIQTIARRVDTTMKDRLRDHGVDFKIFANLMALTEEDGINQRKLGAKLGFPEYYTSRNIDAVVSAGFAERRPDPQSRRSQLVFLTKAGKEKVAEMPDIIREVNDVYLSALTKDERSQVITLLGKIADASKASE